MKLPDDVVKELITELVGSDAVSLVLLIKDKENVSEFKIAEKLNITINEVRNILYRLNEKDLVSYTRKKDNKKGWYIYFWTFNTNKARNLLVDNKKQRISRLLVTMNQEQNTAFFKCPSNCIRLSNEQALESEFKCPECSKLLEQEDRVKRIESIKNEIKRLEEDINELMQLEIKLKAKVKIKEKKKVGKERIIKIPKIKKFKKKKIKKLPQHKPVLKPQKIAIQVRPPPAVKKEKLSLLRRVKRKLFRR